MCYNLIRKKKGSAKKMKNTFKTLNNKIDWAAVVMVTGAAVALTCLLIAIALGCAL